MAPSNADIFPQTAFFRDAIALMNRMDTSKFPLLLARIIKTLHLKNAAPFNEEEKEQLQEVFGLSEAELDNALESCTFILEQAAYFGLQLPAFKEHLQAAELQQEQIIAFLRVWDAEGDNYITKLKEKNFVPRTLTEIKYQLHLDMAQSSMSRLKEPSAIFELTIGSSEADETDKPEKLKMEFNHEQLLAFYNNLETVQRQLDQLS